MKKYILLAVAVLMFGVANAKVIRIHYSDGTTKVYTSSELSTIDFNNNGTVTVYAYDGSLIPQPAGKIYESVTVDDQEAVTEYASRQLEGEVYGVTLGRRNVTAINMVYPSVDPANNSVSLSGTILIPDEIMNGEVESEGVILVHHFTLLSKYNIPTRGYYDASVKFLFCNSLNLNYIVVVSDFYGFGATERFPQAYLLGEANARASLDALKAARRILCNEGINCGPLTFNLGASSAGFDAMEALRVIQTRPGYESIHFDKTFAYAGPYDVKATFNHYIQQDTTYYSVGMPIAMVSYKEHGFLGADYNTMFKPLIADHIDSWFLSKDYTSERPGAQFHRTLYTGERVVAAGLLQLEQYANPGDAQHVGQPLRHGHGLGSRHQPSHLPDALAWRRICALCGYPPDARLPHQRRLQEEHYPRTHQPANQCRESASGSYQRWRGLYDSDDGRHEGLAADVLGRRA